jgi:hypothetical protein
MSDNNSSNKQTWIIAIVIAVIPVIGTIVAAWINRPQQPSPQASTSPPAPSASVSPTDLLSSSPEEIAQEWRQKARQILPPTSGKLDLKEGRVIARTLDLNLRNLIVEATFYNPYDDAVQKWSYGFIPLSSLSENLTNLRCFSLRKIKVSTQFDRRGL